MRFQLFLFALAIFLVTAATVLSDEPKQPAAADAPDRAKLEESFAKLLSGVTLVGHFTANDLPADTPTKEERYTIAKVSKLAGDTWLFQTRIQYGDHDVSLPLPLTVKWAGDTPMVTLDNVGVPGLGTFTARVLFHDSKYAGTWSGGTHGGHLFGRIEKPAAGAADGDKKKAAGSR